MNNEIFVTCPYNPCHLVQRHRIQSHLIKCEKTHPPLQVCPYNATHRFPSSKISEHVKNCPSVEPTNPECKPPKVIAAVMKPKPIKQRDYISETDPDYEMWD